MRLHLVTPPQPICLYRREEGSVPEPHNYNFQKFEFDNSGKIQRNIVENTRTVATFSDLCQSLLVHEATRQEPIELNQFSKCVSRQESPPDAKDRRQSQWPT